MPEDLILAKPLSVGVFQAIKASHKVDRHLNIQFVQIKLLAGKLENVKNFSAVPNTI